MSYTLDVTEANVFTVLRAFIMSVLGTSVKSVIQVPANRVPTPSAYPFMTMTTVSKEQLEFPTQVISDPAVQPQTTGSTMPTLLRVQVDAYGPSSGDIAQILFTALQDPSAFDFFRAHTIQGVYPVNVESLNQLPMVTAEDGYELRWMMQINLQYNPTISATIQTASALGVDVINVEASYS